MSLRVRHIRLRVETKAGTFGADVPLSPGLNILRAENTTGKSTCLQGLLYALGLERMLGPRREIPLPYAMKTQLEDSETGDRHDVLRSSVSVEIENAAGQVLVVQRGVISPASYKLVSVFFGPMLTEPGGRYRQRDYFALDPGAAQRESGFHHALAEFMGWKLPTVTRFDGAETMLYLETIFPLFYVEQKAGWSSIPAGFPTSFQIREVGRRAVEFLLDLEAPQLELSRQRVDAELAASRTAWSAKRAEALSIAEMLNAKCEGLPPEPASAPEEIQRARLVVPGVEMWRSLEDTAALIRERVIELGALEVPTAEETAAEGGAEIERLLARVAEGNVRRNSLFRSRQTEIGQVASIDRRLAALSEDLQKNVDAEKLRILGSQVAGTLPTDQCPTCGQSIIDTLLAQGLSAQVMSVEDNIRFIKSQRDMFVRARARAIRAIGEIELELAAATAEVNEDSGHRICLPPCKA